MRDVQKINRHRTIGVHAECMPTTRQPARNRPPRDSVDGRPGTSQHGDVGERAVKDKRPDLDGAVEMLVAEGTGGRIDHSPDLDAGRRDAVVGCLDHLPLTDFTVELQMPDQQHRAAAYRPVFGTGQNAVAACVRQAHAKTAIGVGDGEHTGGSLRDLGDPPEQEPIGQNRLANRDAVLFAAIQLQPAATGGGIAEYNPGMRGGEGSSFIESQQPAQFAVLAFELFDPREVYG